MPSSEVSLALFVPLKAKDDKVNDVSQFLAAGLDLVLANEPETIQWYGVKYADTIPPTFAILDTFRAESGRAAHLNGKVAEALMANAPTLLSTGPQITQPTILANKVTVLGGTTKTAGLTVGLRVLLDAKPEFVQAVKEFLIGGLELVEAETETPVWYAFELPGTTKFGIVDFFADENGRNAHLNGKVAAALFGKADEWFAKPPSVVKFDVIAASVKM
ncbi:hypothetical protein B0H15DRAFT_862529 [Mycena belliarum]|uniref:ABM domain-containing protein n=1 Tax=Mycena belliarum TaxID=1033014 RepID=A0AAD6XNN0_9AGAR|nr:hypothetical protein B0H15DRAFT_862529 [Mycena belliae]